MKLIARVAALGLALLFAVSVQAEDVRVGYVDMQKVMNETKAGKRAREELEKMFKERRAGFERERQELKNLELAFEKERLLLSDAQKQTKQREYEEKAKAFQQSVAKAERELDQRRLEYERKVSTEARGIVQALAKEEKLSFVFEKNSMPVLYAVDGPDLTAKIIQRLDAKGGG